MLIAGENRLDVDFVVAGSATLDGVVFDDQNGSGVRDQGEPGIPHATVVVVWDGPDGQVTMRVTTDAQGAWQRTALPAGAYSATVDLTTVNPDYRPTTVGGGDSRPARPRQPLGDPWAHHARTGLHRIDRRPQCTARLPPARHWLAARRSGASHPNVGYLPDRELVSTLGRYALGRYTLCRSHCADT